MPRKRLKQEHFPGRFNPARIYFFVAHYLCAADYDRDPQFGYRGPRVGTILEK